MTVDVSVIVPSYNVERYVERAIRSALDQEGVGVEVIHVDDGSTDRTSEIAAGIADPRLKNIQMLQNEGPSGSRNAAIARAGGAWLAVLDSDDSFLPGRLARCLARARAEKADIVVDNLTVLREADGRMSPMFSSARLTQMPVMDLADFIEGNRSFLSGYGLGYLKPVISAEFLRRHGIFYDPEIRIGEDYLLLAEALACGAKCVVEPQAGYLYTARAGSTSHRLGVSDIDRMVASDNKLLSRHSLCPRAIRAQKQRQAGLKRAHTYTVLVEVIKRRHWFQALRLAVVSPPAVLDLWRPVWARLCRAASGAQKDRSAHGRG